MKDHGHQGVQPWQAGFELRNVHTKCGIYAYFAQASLPDAQDDAGFLDGGVGLLRGVVAQPRESNAASHTELTDAETNGCTGRCQRIEHAGRRGIVDDAKERAREAEHLPQPVQGDLLQLGYGRRGTPEHPVDIERVHEHLRQDTRARG